METLNEFKVSIIFWLAIGQYWLFHLKMDGYVVGLFWSWLIIYSFANAQTNISSNAKLINLV